MVGLNSLESGADVCSDAFRGDLRWRPLGKPFKTLCRISLLFLLCLSASIPALFGQVTGGTLTGTVTDPDGSVVPEAAVVATNLGTNTEYRTKTTSAGLYVLPNLPPRTYTLSGEITS